MLGGLDLQGLTGLVGLGGLGVNLGGLDGLDLDGLARGEGLAVASLLGELGGLDLDRLARGGERVCARDLLARLLGVELLGDLLGNGGLVLATGLTGLVGLLE